MSEMTVKGISARLVRLRLLSDRIGKADKRLADDRTERDSVALELVDAGLTWREVADAAGFENPYIAELKRRRNEQS